MSPIGKTLSSQKKKVWGKKHYWPNKLTPGGQVHPVHEIPERDFLDGVLVGAGSLKPLSAWIYTSGLYHVLSLGGSEFQSTVRQQHKKQFKHNKEHWHVLLLNRRRCRTMLCGSMQHLHGRKTCARRQEKHAPDRAWWQVFSISPQGRAKFCTGLQRKKTAAQLTTEDHSFGSSLPFTSTDLRARLQMVSSPP